MPRSGCGPRPLTLTLLCHGNGPTSNEPFVLSKVCFYLGHCEPITVRVGLMMPVVFTPGQVGLSSQSVSETLSTCSALTLHLSGLSSVTVTHLHIWYRCCVDEATVSSSLASHLTQTSRKSLETPTLPRAFECSYSSDAPGS